MTSTSEQKNTFWHPRRIFQRLLPAATFASGVLSLALLAGWVWGLRSAPYVRVKPSPSDSGKIEHTYEIRFVGNRLEIGHTFDHDSTSHLKDEFADGWLLTIGSNATTDEHSLFYANQHSPASSNWGFGSQQWSYDDKGFRRDSNIFSVPVALIALVFVVLPFGYVLMRRSRRRANASPKRAPVNLFLARANTVAFVATLLLLATWFVSYRTHVFARLYKPWQDRGRTFRSYEAQVVSGRIEIARKSEYWDSPASTHFTHYPSLTIGSSAQTNFESEFYRYSIPLRHLKWGFGYEKREGGGSSNFFGAVGWVHFDSVLQISSVPLWPFVILLGFAPTRSWIRTRRRHHSLTHNLCTKCGYDLRASTERCPECGEPLTTGTAPTNSNAPP